ncbi:MAG: hypothetical protein ACRCZE_04060 [Candidatus Altimarinota bacterium]
MDFLHLFTTIFGLIFLRGTSTVIETPVTEVAPIQSEISTTIVAEPEIIPAINVEILAQCLSKKGAVMYGAFWCPHCQSQKELFGDDFQFITYQECDAKGPNGNPRICINEEITGYPTWKFPNHADLVGEQTLVQLALAANCPY